MSNQYAENFFEIPTAIAANDNLRHAVIKLIASKPMPGKVLEDDNENRLKAFRHILTELANGKICLTAAYQQAEVELSMHTSPYRFNFEVFSDRWAERLVRTQFSRFYNQAVLEKLQAEGAETCFIPHSDNEKLSSTCTQQLAGRQHPVALLYARLIDNYSKGNWSREVKIPNHPYCTHVVRPTSKSY